MSVVDWARSFLAGFGLLIALLTLRHAMELRRQHPGAPVNWTGVLGFTVLAVATAADMIRDATLHVPLHGAMLAYGAGYLLAAISLARSYSIGRKS